MAKISVIVPVYNVENYLIECVESLLTQSFNDYEILLIDDGSTDQSGIIAKDFEQKYPEIIKTYHKKNGGLSDARNFGLQRVSGEYVMFIDSDDYIEINSIKRLYEFAKVENFDIIVFDFVKEYKNKSIREHSLSSITVSSYILSTPNACNKMYKTSIFKKNNLFFDKGLWYEDLALIPGLAKFTSKIGYFNEGLYHYRMRDDSIMRQKKFNIKFLDILQVIENLSCYLNNDFRNELEYLAIHHAFYGSSLKLLDYDNKEALRKCKKYLMDTFPNWENNIFYKRKGRLYQFYCQSLTKERYTLCKCLLNLKRRTKDV